MDRPETLRLLRLSHDEVIMLRRRVTELEPKAHAYDTLAVFARLSTSEQQQGYGIDVAWEIKAGVEKLEKERDRDKGNIMVGDFIARYDDAADGVMMDADTAQALAREFKRMREAEKA